MPLKTLSMLSANVRSGAAGVPAITAPSVPRLAWLAHAPSAPTVPSGLTITQKPASIITPINITWPSVSDTCRRTIPW